MKKRIYITLISSMLILILALTACGKKSSNTEIPLNEKIESKAFAYRTDLLDSAETLTDNNKIQEYLLNWAKSKNLKYVKDDHGNIIMSMAASEAYIDAAPVTVVCSYDADSFADSMDAIASALYIIKNNEDSGELNVIFSPISNGNYSALDNLSKEYFKDNTKVISLSGGRKALWSVNSGGNSNYLFSGSLTTEAPTLSTAYKISISGLTGGTPDGKISSYPNPVKMLGDLLASFKTNSLIFELSSISGGNSSSSYPKNAEMIIVISEDDVEKFTTKLDKAIEKFDKKYKEDYPKATYKYEAVSLPATVYTKESQNTLVSSLYTLSDGVFYRDADDEIVTISNIGTIATSEEAFTISAQGYSLDKANLTELDNQYATTCSLAGISYNRISRVQPLSTKFDENNVSKFQKEVMDAYKEYDRSDLEFKNSVQTTPAVFIAKKNSKVNLVNVVINKDKLEVYTGAIVTLLKNQTHKEIKSLDDDN